MPASVTATQDRDAGDSQYYFGWAIGLAVLYSAIHIIARLLASPNLGEDDPLTNILVQQWSAGYSVWQPPMFEWMAWVVQQFGGPSLLGFQLLKYALLIGTIGAVYWAAFYVTGHSLWSLITAEALTLIYHVGWRFHEGFTGIIPAMFFSALALCFVLRIVRQPKLSDFCWLGLAFGGGLLSTHNFAIGIAAFFFAAGFVRDVRHALFRWWLLVTAMIAGASVAPYYAWILSDSARVAQLFSVETIFTNSNPHINFAKAIRKTLGIPFGFFWSLLIFLLVGSLHRVIAHFRERFFPPINWSAHPLLAYLGLYALVSYGLLFLAGLAFSYVRYASHDLLAFMVPVLVLLFGLIFLVEPTEREMRRWGRICFSIIAFAFIARAANMFVLDPVCNICRWGVPYGQLAEQLKNDGFRDGRLVVLEEELGGNLRLYFQNSTIELTQVHQLKANAVRAVGKHPTALAWQIGGRNGLQDPRGRLQRVLAEAGLEKSVRELRAPWSHIYEDDGYRHTVWRYVVLPARN
ncbi:MAG: glycosyltransferase family 39 protein [Pseudomonadota bacterium]